MTFLYKKLISLFLLINLLLGAINLHASDLKNPKFGTKRMPIKLAFVPGLDNVVLKEQGEIIQKFLEKETGYYFDMVIPASFIAVSEAMGTKRVHIALMNSFGYALAHEKFKAKARLIGTFKGKDQYYSQIITHQDGPSKVEDLSNKTFAYVDPASTSGHILPADYFKKNNINLKQTVFAGKHDSVVSMVYQKRVEAGATYHTKQFEGVPQDARTLVKTQYPDVFEKVKILHVLGPIPSDPIVFVGGFPQKMEDKIVEALKKCIQTPEGKNAFIKTYHLDGLKDANDEHWNDFRSMMKNILPESFK